MLMKLGSLTKKERICQAFANFNDSARRQARYRN